MTDPELSLNYPSKVEKTKYDLIIIGGGASGVSAATRMSEREDLEVLLVNAGLPIGGTCVNVGCVPSKILLEMANDYYYSQFPHYNSILGKCACISDVDYTKSVEEKDQMVEELRRKNYKIPLVSMPNVMVINGFAKFRNNHEIEVNDQIYSANKFLISTGSRPRIPAIDGLDKISYLTSTDALSLSELPESLIIIGAGPTGLELTQMFHHFGSDVKLFEAEDQILPGNEKVIADELYKALQEEEIPIYLRSKILQVEQNSDQIEVTCQINSERKTFLTDHILITTGIRPNTEKLNLTAAGVEINEKGYIITDEHLRTTNSNIYAAGDVVGNSVLETTAAREGYLAAGYLYFDETATINYDFIPRAVFTSPNLAVVGLTEQEAIEKYENIESKTIEYTRIPKAVALKETSGKIKMVINSDSRKIVGIHMTAHNAAEFATQASMILKYGLTIDDVIDTVYVFPTMSEGLKKVAQAFIRDVSKMACCVE